MDIRHYYYNTYNKYPTQMEIGSIVGIVYSPKETTFKKLLKDKFADKRTGMKP
jgi:hypothetical protein